MRCFVALLLLALVAGCSRPTVPQAPVLEPAPAVVEPAVCRGAPEIGGPSEQVQAYLVEDRGIASPVLALVKAGAATVRVQFATPVDRSQVKPLLCANGAAAGQQGLVWLSETEAEIRATLAPGAYSLSLGEGAPVSDPYFVLHVMPELRTVRISALPVAGGEPKVLFEREITLTPRSVSPDGRYALLTRNPVEIRNTHSPVAIPYVADLQTGALYPFGQAPIHRIRWDLAGGAVWINGWQKLALDGSASSDRLDRVPSGDGHLLYAEISPDGRWLAALRLLAQAFPLGEATLVVVDLASGEARTLPGPFGVVTEAPPEIHLQWAPDSSRVLLVSYGGKGEVPSLLLVSPADLEAKPVPVGLTEYAIAHWSPGGRYLSVGKHGIITPKGEMVVSDPSLWWGFWSADDRFLVSDGTIIDVATGQGRALGEVGHLLGVASDGSRLFVAK